MNSTRFLKIMVTILVLLNIGTLTFLTLHHRPFGTPPRDDRHGPFEFLCQELKLTSDQRNQYEQWKREHHRAVETLKDKSRDQEFHLFELPNANKDSATVRALADSIAANQKQIVLITFYHFQQLRAICTPQQQKRFDEVIGEALRMLGSKPEHR